MINRLILCSILILTSINSFSQEMNLVANFWHTRDITTIAVSPDGKLLATGSEDNTVILWRIDCKKGLRTFYGHKTDIKAIAFSPDGLLLASTSKDTSILVFDAKNERKKYVLRYNMAKPTSIVFSGNNLLLAAYSDNKIRVWDVRNERILKTLSGHTGSVVELSADLNGKTLASCDQNKVIYVWNIGSGVLIKKLPKQVNMIFSICFINENTLVYGSETGELVFFDLTKMLPVKTFIAANSKIVNLTFIPDKKQLVSYSGNGEIKLWNLDNYRLNSTFSNDNIQSIASAYNSQNNTVIRADYNNCFISSANNRRDTMSCSTYFDFDEEDNGEGSLLWFWAMNGYFTQIANNGLTYYRDWQINNLKAKTTDTSFLSDSDDLDLWSPPVFYSQDNKVIVCGIGSEFIYVINNQQNNKLRILKGHTGNICSFDISRDSRRLVSVDDDGKVIFWDLKEGVKTLQFETGSRKCTVVGLSEDMKYLALGGQGGSLDVWKKSDIGWNHLLTINTEMGNTISSVRILSGNEILVAGDEKGNLSTWSLLTGKKIQELKGHKNEITSIATFSDNSCFVSVSAEVVRVWKRQQSGEFHCADLSVPFQIPGISPVFYSASFSSDGKHIISGCMLGYSFVWNMTTMQCEATFYSFIQNYNNADSTLQNPDWIAIAPDGRFDGTTEGISKLHYVKGNDVIPLENFFEKFYTPNLLARIISGEHCEKIDTGINDIQLPPAVIITSPENNSVSSTGKITITVEVIDQGGGIDEILLYHNGKLIETTNRGFKEIEQKGTKSLRTYAVNLSGGLNQIKVTAFNAQRTESLPDEITVLFRETQQLKPKLYVLVVGIDEYKNPKYKLNYADADADAFLKSIKSGSSGLFEQVIPMLIRNSEATKSKIFEELTKIKSAAQQQDMFVFYYAGHGAMSEEQKSLFYLIPSDVTQMFAGPELQEKAISATELKQFSTEIKAQKQMFVLDACQSGGMEEVLAARGAAEEKAIAQLARSTGTYWLAAANSQQFAGEFTELKHGLFTYCILQAFTGKADAQNDKKVTVQELSAYLNDQVPIISKQYKGSEQYPVTYGFGQDFPVIMLK